MVWSLRLSGSAAFLVICLAVYLAGVAACGERTPSQDSVEFLVEHPERLQVLRAQCKADHAKVGDATCNAVWEAIRCRFMGTGTPYAPVPSPPAPPTVLAPPPSRSGAAR